MALATLVTGALAWGPVPVSGQVAPTITWAPASPGPDDAVDVTVSGCTDEPALSRSQQGSDISGGVVLVADAGGGTWTATLEPSERDVTLDVSCAEGDVEATIDVDNPVLFAIPILAEVPNGAVVTDCFDHGGAGPDVVEYGVATSGGSYPSEAVVAGPPDDPEGDLTLRFTEPFPPGTVTLTVTCGSLEYDPLVFRVRGETATTSTTTAVADPGTAPAATPAVPVGTAARFTG